MSKATFELYRDARGEWRWRLVHDNGNIIADSGEGYERRETARNGIESVRENAPGSAVEVVA
ncbi:HVO_2922 family protein [Haladaptatus salinisoli]|uniref:HVO_2922 family protein n=1 Tax=Haladaptatus salinisoli TaxID=2884876 RepID=UPI001D0B925C|nr:HVO_2922 family protein [Haladaptatus salinisoli]